MTTIAILGSGFGLYGYLPALAGPCGRQVVLPERYRDRLARRPELTSYADRVIWAKDEHAALQAASGVVLAQCPQRQSEWLATCLEQPGLEYLILEKPLAPSPEAARTWHTKLAASGKVVRIAYVLRFLNWVAGLRDYLRQPDSGRLAIRWQFMAHHFRNQVVTWKRDHDQGGGAIRFYGIHLIALLAEMGYSSVAEVSECEQVEEGVRRWRAVFAGPDIPNCDVEVDSCADKSRFSVVGHPGSPRSLHLEQPDPFTGGGETNRPGLPDSRVGVLARFCESAWSDPRKLQDFYRPTIELWSRLEQAVHAQRSCAA